LAFRTASESNLLAAIRVNAAQSLPGCDALARQQQVLDEIDRRGILATPGNSYINELVTEAARLSIAAFGRRALIDYAGTPSVRLGE
jgi:hypothetical protein